MGLGDGGDGGDLLGDDVRDDDAHLDGWHWYCSRLHPSSGRVVLTLQICSSWGDEGGGKDYRWPTFSLSGFKIEEQVFEYETGYCGIL